MQGVISINSKSGAEAVLLGKPTLVLGDAFYRNAPLVTPIDSILEVGLNMHLFDDQREIDKKQIEEYFQSIWDASFPGELYAADPKNVKTFCSNILTIENNF